MSDKKFTRASIEASTALPQDDPDNPASISAADAHAIADTITGGTKLDAMAGLSFFLGYHVSTAQSGDAESIFLLREFLERYPKFSLAILVAVPDLYPRKSLAEH